MDAQHMTLDDLDYAIAALEYRDDAFDFHPTTRWEDGGPIIERQGIALRENNGTWYAMHGSDVGSGEIARWIRLTTTGGKRYGNFSYQVHKRVCRYKGDTPLEAAMRCYVGFHNPSYERRK